MKRKRTRSAKERRAMMANIKGTQRQPMRRTTGSPGYTSNGFTLYRAPASQSGRYIYYFAAPGHRPNKDAAPAKLPAGYTVKRSSNGLPFLSKA